MQPSIIVWGPGDRARPSRFAAANDLVGKSDVEVREAIGDKFPFSGKFGHLYCVHLTSSFCCLVPPVLERADDFHECFGHTFMEMRRDGRAGVHNDVQHYGPQSVIRVSDTQRDVAFAGEGETIRLELTFKYFLIDHDAVSRIEEPPCRFNLGGCALVPGTHEKGSMQN